MSSFKSYGKVDESEQARLEARRKTRKRVTIIALSTIVLIGVVCAAVFGTVAHNNSDNNDGVNSNSAPFLSNSVKGVCDVTLYKGACYSSIGPLVHSGQVRPEKLFLLSIEVALAEASRAVEYFSEKGVFNGLINVDNKTMEGFKNCKDLLGLAVDHLNSSLASGGKSSLLDVLENLRTWLSAAGTYQQTCIDGFGEAGEALKTSVVNNLKNSTEFTSNSLAIVTWLNKAASTVNLRRLFGYVVTGNIFNLLLFFGCNLAVFGKNFIARDMGFRNTAGPQKHQAVALMTSADQAVYYRCQIDAFQDSLYAHSNRQFYRECNIYGTVDFIFGNSAVVLQNCNIFPRVPMQGQQNTITAQGKTDPNMNTGISIQSCNIAPFGDLSSVKTYLGRPWKNYSTTVFMQSTLGSFIHPNGWLPWVGDSAPDTIFYAEFQNVGPGSSTKNRVKWKGLKTITKKQASMFTVNAFLSGEKWITASGAPFKSST
ncbi:hypothetical protein JHK82_036684 [Glycine max]|nr:hypothetical protein JHK82_036684 [Glycine max]